MNAVEIEEALSELAEAEFDAAEFPFLFLQAFGNKDTTIRRLRAASNSDIPGAILQKSNIHLAVSPPGQVSETLGALRGSPRTARNKCKFILATDGELLEAEDTASGEHIACKLPELPDHFGFLLPLAGISTVAQIKNNPIDIRATRHLNKLYIALLSENPDWAAPERRNDLNQFMARMIFCFFAEDTGIFFGEDLFTKTLMQYSAADSSNTHEVISELFRAMDTPNEAREKGAFRNWANAFPYVNGGLFAGTRDVPKFSKMARATLLAAGGLKWTHINPDIFGSMIQAVADEDERGALGMHYTSVPNIMKVLGPLFLDELTAQLEEAGDNARKLLNLRRRLARVRVFDPACGSGNFMVIAYIRMREIEHEIIRRRKDDPKSVIRLTQFYGIEIKSFPAEIARLALLIAEFQCNVRMIGQQEAIIDILPLHQTGNIHCGNALRMDWLEVCPPPKVSMAEEDLAGPTGRLALEGGVEEAWETYICGNPPYLGSKKKNEQQVQDMEYAGLGAAKLLDYVAAFIVKAVDCLNPLNGKVALVSTSSICQGEQVGLLWPTLLEKSQIFFAYAPFKWSNSAQRNAGVFCTIVGLSLTALEQRKLFVGETLQLCKSISPYLVSGAPVVVEPRKTQISGLAEMKMGSNPVDGTRLILSSEEYTRLIKEEPLARTFIRPYGGTEELVSGVHRWCIWIADEEVAAAVSLSAIQKIVESCKRYREGAGRDARKAAGRPHAFCYSTFQNRQAVHVGNTIGNEYFCVPADLKGPGYVSSHAAFTVYGQALHEFSIIVSKIHFVWAATVSGRLGNGIRYGNTVVYNTFPVPKLTEANKADLTRCAEDILLAREAHFPATIADLYDPENMPENLRAAHERNDTVIEEIYIGRRFRNDTERLEKLFDMYTRMTKKGTA